MYLLHKNMCQASTLFTWNIILSIFVVCKKGIKPGQFDMRSKSKHGKI